MTKIIVFGAGRFYQCRKKEIYPNVQIVAFADNNPALQGEYIDGIPVVSPSHIGRFSYDKVLLMSKNENADDMKRQLVGMGIDEKKIYYWEQFHDEMNCGVLKFYCGASWSAEGGKSILIISTDLNYNGGTMVVVYAAKVLQSRGYRIILAAPDGTQRFIDETVEEGVNVIICPSLNNIHKEELFWIQQFDFVLVNVFQMIQCACEISKLRPVLWWIHERKELFEETLDRHMEYACPERMSEANIYAVSSISQKHFNHYFPGRIKEILSFGIPDENESDFIICSKKNMVFAIIGVVIPIKAQDIFVQAVSLLSDNDKKNAEFWLIGTIWENEYADGIRNLVEKEPSIKILGELTRYEIHKKYEEIDVVVCPSWEETMSIAVMEGMMYGKVCVASEGVGMSAYIKEGVNGLTCKTGNPEELSAKIKWIIDHRDGVYEMGQQARKTYEEYFTMDKFGDKLEKAIQDTSQRYFQKGN